MKYDLIIVSNSKSKPIIDITQNCIDTAVRDLDRSDINVIVVETGVSKVRYNNCDDYVMYDRNEFCYNHALNQGIKRAKNEVFILANNDIVFTEGWSKIGDLMVVNGYMSASALSESIKQKFIKRGNYIYEGYTVGTFLTGWCIFVHRSVIEKIGQLDESFDFWYSDNIYADQLIDARIKHGLFCNVQVNHITSVTLKTLPVHKQRSFSVDSTRKYKIIHAKRKRGNKTVA